MKKLLVGSVLGGALAVFGEEAILKLDAAEAYTYEDAVFYPDAKQTAAIQGWVSVHAPGCEWQSFAVTREMVSFGDAAPQPTIVGHADCRYPAPK